MPKFYFTFGFGQKHQNKFVVIEADSYGEARKEMVEQYGNLWAFQYEEKNWICKSGKTQQEEYGLQELK